MTQETLGWWVHQNLGQAFHKWGKQEAAVSRGDDPESIHQMRVAMRRLRAGMSAFRAVLDLPRATRKVGMISRVLGQARDTDVMLAHLEVDYFPALPPAEQTMLRQFMDDLRQQRQAMQRELVALLTSATYGRVKEAWAKWLAAPRWQPLGDWPVAEALPHLLVIAWAGLALHLGWRVEDGTGDREQLHDLRKAIKRTRYLWEFAQEQLPTGLMETLTLLRQAQDILGHLQDGFVLESRLGSTCPRLHQLLTQQQAQVWQTWQTLREQLAQGARHDQVYQHLGQQCRSGNPPSPDNETVRPSAILLG
ncbi:MAG: CHAD domain-containing protein [Gloeomargarita sp. DG02_5_bins_242]